MLLRNYLMSSHRCPSTVSSVVGTTRLPLASPEEKNICRSIGMVYSNEVKVMFQYTAHNNPNGA